MGDWSKLPVELLGMIAVRLFSIIELLRFRSICTSWRSSVSGADNPIPPRPLILLNPLIATLATNDGIYELKSSAFLSRASFFRVTPSSSLSPGKGWLIKSDENVNSKKLHLLNPLSRLALPPLGPSISIDLLELTVSEIRESYVVQNQLKRKITPGFKKVVLVKDQTVIGIGCDGKIRYWNGEAWIRIKDQFAQFSDIIVHKGLTYALDSEGIVWWISSSLSIFRYGTSLDKDIIADSYSEKSLVECCGELYIVDRLLEDSLRKRKTEALDDNVFVDDYITAHLHRFVPMIHDDVGNEDCKLPETYPKTVGFKVYKMDEELGKWVEVKSLGDNAFMIATDCCFSVLAHDFCGCLQNSIYFTDEEFEIRVFNLDDGSITTTTTTTGTTWQSCFQMFIPIFV